LTALLTPGMARVMSASRRRPTSCFQPGMAAMKACTGASPYPFAICGLPPERRTTFSPFRDFTGWVSFATGLAFAPAFAGSLAFVPAPAVCVALAAGLRAPLARDARWALDFALLWVILRPL